jgi:hypothetical protein
LQFKKEKESENLQLIKDKLNEVKNNKNSIESEIKSFKDKTKELEKLFCIKHHFLSYSIFHEIIIKINFREMKFLS